MSLATAPTAVIAEDEPVLARTLTRLLAQVWPELRIVGIAEDMAAGMLGWQDELARLPCPTTIIYGPDDPVAMFARSSTSASFPRLLNLQPLRGGGHLVVASHPKEVWDVLLTAIGADK